MEHSPLPDELPDDLATLWYLVRRVAGLMDREGEALLQRRELGISLAQFLVLSVVDAYPGHLSQQAIADRLGLTKGTVSRQIDTAVEAGLMTVQVASHTRRENAVALTKAGTALVHEGDELMDLLPRSPGQVPSPRRSSTPWWVCYEPFCRHSDSSVSPVASAWVGMGQGPRRRGQGGPRRGTTDPIRSPARPGPRPTDDEEHEGRSGLFPAQGTEPSSALGVGLQFPGAWDGLDATRRFRVRSGQAAGLAVHFCRGSGQTRSHESPAAGLSPSRGRRTRGWRCPWP